MEFMENEKVKSILDGYPDHITERLYELRQLIIDVAEKTVGVDKLMETIKWAEPSYVTKTGSTIRLDWKAKTPEDYFLFFICSTELVSTFKFIFGDELKFEGKRAIVLSFKPLPKDSLTRCIQLALTYHRVKHLPMLGQ